jgi:hypothetical protein
MFRKEKKIEIWNDHTNLRKQKSRVCLELVGIGRKDYHYQSSLSHS